MNTEQTLVNRYGDLWIVEQRESERLTHIGGFLMIHNNLGWLTLSALLSVEDKAWGREHLLSRLAETPIGTAGTVLWHPNDDPTRRDRGVL
jgi:hypothetical protein